MLHILKNYKTFTSAANTPTSKPVMESVERFAISIMHLLQKISSPKNKYKNKQPFFAQQLRKPGLVDDMVKS